MALGHRPNMARVTSDVFEEPVPELVLVAVADTLRISRDDILLSDSFAELGGDERSAHKLEERLRKKGVSIAAQDALRCRTMAELQTCAKSTRSSGSASYNSSDRFSAESGISSNPKEIFTPTRTRGGDESFYGTLPGFPPESNASHGRDASPMRGDLQPSPLRPHQNGGGEAAGQHRHKHHQEQQQPQGHHTQNSAPKPTTTDAAGLPGAGAPSGNSDQPPAAAAEQPKVPTEADRLKQLEELFQSVAGQDRFCVTKSAAGPFSKKLVGFVSLRAESCDASEGIKLAIEDEYNDIEKRINAFWAVRQRKGPDLPWPEYWIPLRALVTKSGDKPATRALQWWMRNLPEDVEQRTYTLQRLLGLHLLERDHPAPPRDSSQNRREPSAEPPRSRDSPHRKRDTEESTSNRSRELLSPKTTEDSHRSPSHDRSHHDDRKKERHRRDEAQREPQTRLDSPDLVSPRTKMDEPPPNLGSAPRDANEALMSDDAYVHIPIPMIPEGEGARMSFYDGPGSRRRSAASRKSSMDKSSRMSRKQSLRNSLRRSVVADAEQQARLSTTRPEKTFSMWIENEAAQHQMHEQMGETLDDAEFFPLSAMQQLFFRTSMNLDPKPDSITKPGYRFSQSILLRINGDLEPETIENSIAALVGRHSMLRSRFRLTREGWAQVILPDDRNSFRFDRHTIAYADEVHDVMDVENGTIDAVNGPVFSAAHVQVQDGSQLLFLVAHHLAVDLVSWRIMVDDLDELFRHGTVLTDPSIPFSNWIEYQAYETSHRLVQPKLPFEIAPPSLGYWDLDLESNRYGSAESFTFTLDSELTHTLRHACQNVFRTEPDDLFLAALLLSFCKTFPDRHAPTMWTQEHGRDTKNAEFNIDETVGWFTTLCPIRLTTNEHGDIMELMKLMKDTRNVIPDAGISFFNSEFLVPSAPYTTIPVEILFNFINKVENAYDPDAILEPASGPGRFTESLTSDIGTEVGRIALFEISVAIEENETKVNALYIKPQRKDRIEQWLESFQTLVVEAINKLGDMGPELTLADAPLLRTTYQGLSKLADQRLAALGMDSVGEIETLQPANPSQQEIVIAQSLDPECFHVHGIYELTTESRKPVDNDALVEAWSFIVETHAALRSVFIDSVSEDGVFDQVVLKETAPQVVFLESVNPLETLARMPAMETLPSQPRHRLAICKTENKTYIRIDASQAICDAITIDNLVTKMRQAMSGEDPEDNVFMQQSWLFNATTMDTTVNLQSWSTALEGARPCIFPSLVAQQDKHKHRRSQYTGLEITVDELRDFCIAQKVEGAYVLQLAWALVLRIYAGMNHVSFGYEVSGRSEAQMPEMKSEAGSFAALLPCTVDLSPGRTISECLQSLGEIAAIARQSQNPTMPEILHTTHIDNLFNTCLSMRDFANARHKHPELDATSFRANLVTSSRLSNTDVSVSTMFIDDHIHIDISTRHISPAQVRSIVNSFERAIRLILTDPEQNISGIELFTEADEARLAKKAAEAAENSGEGERRTLHQMILQHAQYQPKAQAISAWDGNMTYNQFSYCVATLATYLRNIGIAPGLAVPVVMEKSKWAPVIMLAVMKAGGSIICMDATDKSFVDAAIKQLEPRIVVATDSAWNDVVCIVPNLVIVNERFFSILPPQVSIPMQQASADHGACVIYAPSKSRSGPAKSLFFTHGSLVALFMKQGPALKLNRDSRVLQLSAYSVDIALVEILATLLHGGCVCIPTGKEKIPDLGGFMASKKVTWSYMTTALVRRVNPASVPDLKTVCFRTRRMDEDTLSIWLKDRTVLMAYGTPDVCPLGIAVEEVNSSHSVTVVPPPLLGRFWILNPEDPKKLMPIGAIGELAIDCPAIRPHKFHPGHKVEISANSPSAKEPPSSKLRYLKMGHRVRYLNEDAIQFLSSTRDETFLQGSPVSVTNVEQHLRRYLGGHADVVVEAVTTSDEVQLLAAFLELGDDLSKDSEEFEQLRKQTNDRGQLVRAFQNATFTNLSNKSVTGIPPEFVPTVFIPRKYFPLSASLKINRRKLQKMVAATTYKDLMGMSTAANQPEEEAPEKTLPLTHVEERMRHIWAGILDIPLQRIKSDDSFLGLGGDKFLAIKLIVACRKSDITVSLGDLLKGATLAEICQALPGSEEEEEPDIGPSGLEKEGASTIESQSLSGFDDKFLEQVIAPQMKVDRRRILDVAEASAYQIRALETRLFGKKVGMKCLVFNFDGAVRVQKLMTACETLSKLHPIFRTAFAVHDRHVYQVLIDGFMPEFQRYPCPAWCLGSVADNVISEDQEAEFKPEEPATKFTFLDAGPQSTLIIRLSNAQIDEGAMVLLVRDLASLYEGQGSISYRPTFFDYMRAVDAQNTKSSLEYWRRRLKGAKMTKFVSHARPYLPTSDIKTLRQTLTVPSVTEYGLTFSTILKAAWAICLAEHASRSDVVFGEIVQGHHVPLPDKFDLFSMIGPTTNILPVRVRFTDTNETPLDFMRRIQERSNASRPHEGMGILQVVQRCTNWRYWSRFSTVLHHRSLPPLDGSTTLNMGDISFTHSAVENGVQDIPDLLITTSMAGPETVNFEMQFSESRVPSDMAEEALRVLTIAVGFLTSDDTIESPIVQSGPEITRSPAKIPLPGPPGLNENKDYQSLPHDERQALQAIISSIWTTVLDPKPLGVPEDQLHKANFYDLWGSVLPAHFFAERINAELMAQPIKGLNKLQVTGMDIIENPTMAMQYDLIVRKLADAGISFGNIRRRTLNWGYTQSGQNGDGFGSVSEGASSSGASTIGRENSFPAGEMQPTPSWPTENPSLRKKAISKLRGLHSSSSIGSKAGDLLKGHRGSRPAANEGASTSPQGVMIGAPVATELPPRAIELRNQQRTSGYVAPSGDSATVTNTSLNHIKVSPNPNGKPGLPFSPSPSQASPAFPRSASPSLQQFPQPPTSQAPMSQPPTSQPPTSAPPTAQQFGQLPNAPKHLSLVPSFVSSVSSNKSSDKDTWLVSPTTIGPPPKPPHEALKRSNRRDSFGSTASDESDSPASPLGPAWMAM